MLNWQHLNQPRVFPLSAEFSNIFFPLSSPFGSFYETWKTISDLIFAQLGAASGFTHTSPMHALDWDVKNTHFVDFKELLSIKSRMIGNLTFMYLWISYVHHSAVHFHTTPQVAAACCISQLSQGDGGPAHPGRVARSSQLQQTSTLAFTPPDSLQMPAHLTCMSLNCGWKPEYATRAHDLSWNHPMLNVNLDPTSNMLLMTKSS